MGARVIALYSADHPEASYPTFVQISVQQRIHRFAVLNGYELIVFTTPDQLVDELRMHLAKVNQSLDFLEILSHGSTISIDGLNLINVDAFGQRMYKELDLTVTPRCQIYLSGCNTGLRMIAAGEKLQIAQALANASMCRVYGTLGYLSTMGSKTEGTARTIDTSSNPDKSVAAGPQPGSTVSASGDACYQEFNKK